MATAAVIDYLFQRTLDDLIRGLRVQSIGESRYIGKALEEIRKEIKSTDGHTKSVALQKLVYLNMIHGIDMSWAAFHVVEVMSLPKFAHKKIGYLAASQSFHQGTEVLLLITNLLKKDLSSKNEFEAGLALECLSRIATPDLARDLTQEVFTMLASSKLHIRKKATLVLLRIFSQYPDGIRLAFKRLVEKLEDPDSQVVAAALSVLYELARKDPRPYLPLAPEFYRLLVETTNNWMCIKLVKIFALLLPLEPRLSKKIAEPLCQQMQRTSAKSLVFECISTVTVGLLENPTAVELSGQKLKEILSLEEDDPNLKYLGLKALLSFMQTHPSIVADNKSVIIKCLSHGDTSVQRGSLRLIIGMVSDSNITETVQVLIRYGRTADKSFCNELISSILSTCNRNFYELISDFTWYINVLGELARLPQFDQGPEVERQLIDIGLRVESVRKDLLRLAKDLQGDSSLWENTRAHRVLAAAAWLLGEYVQLTKDPFELIGILLQPRLKRLSPQVQAIHLQAVLKIFVFFEGTGQEAGYEEIGGDDQVPSLSRMVELIKENAGPFRAHVDSEVQERASNLFSLIEMVGQQDLGNGEGGVFAAMRGVFGAELGPVSVAAQKRIAVPVGLELLDNLEELKNILGESSSSDSLLLNLDRTSLFEQKPSKPLDESQQAGENHKHHRQRNETYYLPKDTEPEPEAEASLLSTSEAATTQEDNSNNSNFSKAAEETLVWTSSRRPRSRPVVIRLVEEEQDYVSAAAAAGSTSSKDTLLVLSKVDERPRQGRKSQNSSKKKHHHRQRAKSPLQVAPKVEVVPDFLL